MRRDQGGPARRTVPVTGAGRWGRDGSIPSLRVTGLRLSWRRRSDQQEDVGWNGPSGDRAVGLSRGSH
jgi:hypothetical protein